MIEILTVHEATDLGHMSPSVDAAHESDPICENTICDSSASIRPQALKNFHPPIKSYKLIRITIEQKPLSSTLPTLKLDLFHMRRLRGETYVPIRRPRGLKELHSLPAGISPNERRNEHGVVACTIISCKSRKKFDPAVPNES